jgi:hypothetical protein
LSVRERIVRRRGGEREVSPGSERTARRWAGESLRSLRRLLEERETPALRVEVHHGERRMARPLAGASPRRREGLCAGRTETEQCLRRRRAVESLVRAEHDVV